MQNRWRNKLYVCLVGLISCAGLTSAHAASPIFTLTPTTPAPQQITSGSVAEAIYQVTNNAPATMPDEGLVDSPSSVTQITGAGLCGSSFSLASGASCNLEMDISGNASGGPLICYTPSRPVYCSKPTVANQLAVRVITAGISTPSLVFSTPGQQSLVLTNNASQAVNVTQVQLIRGNLADVTVGTIPGACQPLAAGASCNVPLTAIADSFGSGRAVVSYTLGGETTESTTTVSVANTTVSINSGNEVKLNPSQAGQSITITNTGNFTWQNVAASLASSLTNTTIATNTCSGTLAVGASCQISFTTTGATLGQSTTLNVTGNNIATTEQNVTIDGGVTVEPDVEAANTHLFYRAVKVENLSPNAIQLTSVTVNNLDNQVKWCQSGDADCDFTSTCQLNTNIASQASCLLWFESEIPASNPTPTTATGTIAVTDTTSSGKNATTTLNVAYGLNLFVGGFYTTANAGAVTATNIAYWDGSNWNALIVGANNGVNGPPIAFATYRGDLYSGGFTEGGGVAVNRVAYWNGSTWNNLGSGVNDLVQAFSVIGDTLYVGGEFTTAGGNTANRIASWNGSTWSALGDGLNSEVNALTSIGTTLYAGGEFTTAGGNTANRVAQWNGTTWSALANGVDTTVHALRAIGSILYVGGDFTTVNAGAVAANRIASWNGTAWSALGDGVNNGVRGLTTIGSTLYVSGLFTTAGGIATPRVASWNGSAWSAVVNASDGSGPNNSVTRITSLGNTLYGIGAFTRIGAPFASRVASWEDGSDWTAIPSSSSGGVGGTATAVAIAPSLNITS